MGLFGRNIESAYAARDAAMPMAVASPWQPTDVLTQFTIDQLFAEEIASSDRAGLVTRDMALRVPAVKRAHGIHCTLFAQTPFSLVDADGKAVDPQPSWLANSASGVAPYHRKFGMASDWFFNGWAALGFNASLTDAIHIPYGMWKFDNKTGRVVADDDRVNPEYTAYIVAIPLGYGENGMLTDGIDTLREARLIEQAYMDRLRDPVPLTILNIPQATWEQWTPEERKLYRDQWVKGRRDGATALKVAEFGVEFPGAVAVDLYETGRNAARLDIANHTGTPAGLIEGLKQGGSGGTEIRYSGVANGAGRNELWDFGLAKRMALAFEARMSLDDISPVDHSIRGDYEAYLSVPGPTVNPTSEA